MIAISAIHSITLAQYANDNATQTAYDDGWTTGDNGGTGFSAWTLEAGVFVFSDGRTDCNIYSGTKAWGMWADGTTAQAIRPFSQSLNVGDIISLQMDNGNLDGGSSAGFTLRNSSGETIFEFYNRAGSNGVYKVNDNAGESDITGFGWTNLGMNIRFTLTSSTTYSISINPLWGTTVYTKTGTLKAPAGGSAINAIRMFYYDNTTTSQDVYFNNLRIFQPLGNALHFDGSNDRVDIATSTTLAITTNKVTLEAWIKSNNSLTEKYIVSLKNYSTDYGVDIALNAGYIKSSAHLGSWKGVNSGVAYTNTWYHVAVVVNGTTETLFVNGNEVGTTTGTANLSTTDCLLSIGCHPAGISYFEGNIDEVRVWNTARSQSDIQNNMYNYLAGNESGLVAYYRFDQGNAGATNAGLNKLVDYSGNCNTGTLNGFDYGGSNVLLSNWVATGNNEAPILTTTDASSISYSSAILNGNITSIGESSVTTRGFQISTNACMSSPTVVSENGPFTSGTYNLSTTWLTQNTIYYYRAFATNTQGTSYGETQSFTTTAFQPLGNVLDFDGTNDYVNVAGGGGLNNLQTGTIEMWVKWNGTQDAGYSGYGHVLSRQSDGNFSNQTIGLSTSDPSTAKIIWFPYSNVPITGNATVGDNQWVHIAITYQSGEHKIYVNGLLDVTSTTTGSISNNSSIPIAIGAWTGDGIGYAKAQIDEFRVWNTLRSQSDIQNNMYNYLAGNESGLLTYYRFDQGSAGNDNTALVNEVIDYSGNCNKGTLTNFVRTGATSNWVATSNAEAPILATTDASAISYNTATLNGNVFSIGESNVTTRGFQISTSSCMTTPTVVSENGTFASGTFSLNATGLLHSTIYYCRAFATNSKGTSYGETKSFTTTAFQPLGNVLDFDGVNATQDYVVVADNTNLRLSAGSFTIEFWAKPTQTTGWVISKDYSNSTGQLDYLIGINGSQWRFIARDLSIDILSSAITLSNWYHVACTFNGTTASLYVNGILVGTDATVGSASTSTANVLFGARVSSSPTQFFTGSLDEVRIWNSARTQSDIQNNMYSYITGTDANLKAYYRFDQGDGGNNNTALVNEVIDYSGNCNKGTLTNFARTGATSNWLATSSTEAPILTTTDASAISYNTAALNSNVYTLGETAITLRGFQYSTNTCFSTNVNTISEAVSATGAYSLSPTWLAQNTIYYYRAFATNSKGTTYGETKSFTTTAFTPFGNVLDFDGSDNVSIPALNLNSNTVTLEAWINPIVQTNTAGIIFTRSGNSIAGLLIRPDNSISSCWNDYVNASGLTALPNQWSHVALVIEPTKATVYVNGVASVHNHTYLIEEFDGITMLGFDDFSSRYLKGQMDEVRIWNTSRSQSEIQNNMYNYLAGNESGLVAYYRLDQGNASGDNTTLADEVIDYSGNCNKGTYSATFARTGATSNWVATGNSEAPIITVNAVNYASFASAQLAGKTISIGETNVTQRGFQYATDACFSSNLKTSSESGTFNTNGEVFSSDIYGLLPNTTYYYRSYATNTKGTSYGETRSFTTESVSAPGTCLSFDGTDDYVSVLPTVSVSQNNAFTVESWFYSDKTKSSTIYAEGNSSSNNPMFSIIPLSGASNIEIVLRDNGAIGLTTTCPNTNWVANQWNHLAVVRYSATSIKVYLNGILTEDFTFSAPAAWTPDNCNIGVRKRQGFDSYMKGKIDEVKIWNVARTQEEIISYMNQTILNPSVETNLVAYYNFDENAGTSTNDETANNNDGTLENGTTWANSDAFNIWTGATDNVWATSTNWSDGVPDASDNLSISLSSNQPAVAGDLTLNTLVVPENITFTQTAGNLLTVNSNLLNLGNFNISASAGANPGMVTVNGDLYVGSTGTLNILTPTNDNAGGSLITNGAVLGTGTVNINRYFSVYGSWQYLGVALENQLTSLFTENLQTNEFNRNLYTYAENFDFTTDPVNANYSNWNAQTGYWQFAQAAGWGHGVPMQTGTGYLFYNNHNSNIRTSSVATNLTNSDKTVSVSYTNNDNGGSFGNNYDGWNLISNPFPSAIDWTLLTKSPNCNATVYFYDSQTGNFVYNSGTPLWSVAPPTITAGGQYIPPMQAFWVHLSSGSTIAENFTFNKSARVHNAQRMYKSSKKAEFEYIKLKATNNQQTDELMLGYFGDATLGFDSKYDAIKRFAGNSIPMFYSFSQQPEMALALNALPLEYKQNKVKLGYQSTVTGTHTIGLSETNTNIPIILVDLLENKQVDLTQGDYTFEFQAGEINNRFELFTSQTVVNQPETLSNVLIYPNPTNGKITIDYSNQEIQKIIISDVSGKIVFAKSKFQSGETIDLSAFEKGIYLIHIQTEKGNKTEKIILK